MGKGISDVQKLARYWTSLSIVFSYLLFLLHGHINIESKKIRLDVFNIKLNQFQPILTDFLSIQYPIQTDTMRKLYLKWSKRARN